MPLSKPERYRPLTRDEHDEMVEAMGTISRAGDAAGKLAVETVRWQRLTSTEIQMRKVLLKVGRTGWWARDVLDMMEDNELENTK